MTLLPEIPVAKRSVARPFRSAVLRGLAIVLPPLLTIVIFLWIGGTLQQYLLRPLNNATRNLLVWLVADVRYENGLVGTAGLRQEKTRPDGLVYRRLESGSYVPKNVYDTVVAGSGEKDIPKTSAELYARYVELTYMRPHVAIPFFLCLFVLALYLLGKFMAAGMGRVFFNLFEGAFVRIPVVRSVYSAVKQVSEFLLAERQILSSRVVAIEYPRAGIWAMAIVTGEGLENVEAAAKEPLLSVFVPTSPMPMTGFTAIVKKSEAIELSITVDQAFQYLVSCGVVVPGAALEKFRIAKASAPEPSQ